MILENYPFLQFILAFFYTILIVFIIARYLYYRSKGKTDFLYALILLAAIVFQICILLVRVPIELGFAIGLFAIFGIIRYRTIPIKVREMTYLFVCIGIAAKNALIIFQTEAYKILVADLLILVLITLLELFLFKRRTMEKSILFNKLELIHEDKRPELIADLQASYGIRNIEKVQVGKIDTFKQTAQLKVFFHDTGDKNFNEND